MWFVIQSLKGQEHKDLEEILREVEIYGNEEVFSLENEKPFRIRSEWILESRPFFPGYIFVDTEDGEDFSRRLRKKPRTRRMLEMDGVITPIRPNEEEYLQTLGGEEHIIRYSEGYRIGDRVEIVSGAFAGYKGRIDKLDRHNRRAKLFLPLMGQEVEVEIGLGIVKSI